MTGRREGALAGGPLLRHGPEPASRRHGSGWAVAVLAAAPQEGPVHVSVFEDRLSGIGEEEWVAARVEQLADDAGPAGGRGPHRDHGGAVQPA